MFQRERTVLAELSSELARFPSVVRAIAYGSRVRGDERVDSDFDILLVVTEKHRTVKDALRTLFYRYELEWGLSFSVAILTLDEISENKRIGSPFIANVLAEGLTFYDAHAGRQIHARSVST